MKKGFVVVLVLMLVGCASVGKGPVSGNTLNSIKDSGAINQSNGVLLLSAGRERNPCDECNANFLGILPFVSYSIFHEKEGEEPEELAFIPAEAGLINRLDKSNYGFIHMRELPEGKYSMVGVHSRGHGVMLPAGGYFVYLSDGRKETAIVFKFEVQANKINYLGELLTTNGRLENSSIRQSWKQKRDSAFAIKKYPELESLEVINTELRNPL